MSTAEPVLITYQSETRVHCLFEGWLDSAFLPKTMPLPNKDQGRGDARSQSQSGRFAERQSGSRILNFYLDDSGTRAPNRKPLSFDPRKRNFFALGGVLINEEDEAGVRAAYEDFCRRWLIAYPLHSVEIRHCSHAFGWLKRGAVEYDRFMRDLSRFLTAIDVVGLACVVDRPGYDARYRAKYGRRQWHLCQTAFSVVVERAAKFARSGGRKLRVMPERSSRDDESRIRKYFESLKENGTPFDRQTSAQYSPMGAAEFSDALYFYLITLNSRDINELSPNRNARTRSMPGAVGV